MMVAGLDSLCADDHCYMLHAPVSMQGRLLCAPATARVRVSVGAPLPSCLVLRQLVALDTAQCRFSPNTTAFAPHPVFACPPGRRPPVFRGGVPVAHLSLK